MTDRAPLDMDHVIEIRHAVNSRATQCEQELKVCPKWKCQETADYWRREIANVAAAKEAFDATVKWLDQQGV